MFSTSKVKRSQKFVSGQPDGFCGLDLNLKKNWRKFKSTNQNKNFPKKTMFRIPLKCKAAKDSYGGYPTEFAGSTQNLYKYCRYIKSTNQNNNFPKKVCLVP
jgi:hypothetical protein